MSEADVGRLDEEEQDMVHNLQSQVPPRSAGIIRNAGGQIIDEEENDFVNDIE